MASVALLSNPRSTGNRSLLPQVREYCAAHPDIFHYEVEDVDQIEKAIRTMAMVGPRVVVINGGDGTVQAALTEIYSGDHFGGSPPPVAVLPNGKTNLIALDLGAEGDPIKALQRVVELVESGRLEDHVIERQLIALDSGGEERPVLGMFLGGAYLADVDALLPQSYLPARPAQRRVALSRGDPRPVRDHLRDRRRTPAAQAPDR